MQVLWQRIYDRKGLTKEQINILFVGRLLSPTMGTFRDCHISKESTLQVVGRLLGD